MPKLLLVLLGALPLMAQLPSNTLTITATRSVAVQPDQLVFGLTVSSSQTTNLDQIVAALADVSVTSSNFTGFDSSSAPLLDWDFTLAVPISNLTSTINSLTSLQKTITKDNSGLTLTFTVNGTQVSQQLQQSQLAQSCSDANLISDATAQAQKLASAANVTLGPVIKLSNAALPTSAGAVQPVAYAELALAAYIVPVNYSPPTTCSLSVQFQLLP